MTESRARQQKPTRRQKLPRTEKRLVPLGERASTDAYQVLLIQKRELESAAGLSMERSGGQREAIRTPRRGAVGNSVVGHYKLP